MKSRDERLARHPLPQSSLHTPLFAGVEPPIVGFEVVVLVVVFHVTQLAWLPLAITGAGLAVVHILLAAATRRDRRLTMVAARALRYPRYARPWPTDSALDCPGSGSRSKAEPTFPRKALP